MPTHGNYKNSIGIQEISNVTRKLKHNPLIKRAWEQGDIYKVYDCVVKILPDMTFEEFDYHAQYRTIFHEDFITACNEIAHCMAHVA